MATDRDTLCTSTKEPIRGRPRSRNHEVDEMIDIYVATELDVRCYLAILPSHQLDPWARALASDAPSPSSSLSSFV